ncbi:MAG: MerC family mercury resistance protein [Chthoniobacterales bacterium]
MAVLVALFPKCPLCWSAYASLLSTFGIVSFPYYDWILPMMIGLLVIQLFALGIMARNRRRYGPFILSVVGAGIILIGKLGIENAMLVYMGVSLVAASSLWNILTRKFACRVESETPQ